MIVFSWSCSSWDTLLTLLSNPEAIDIMTKLVHSVILARCTLELASLDSICTWSRWRGTKIDVRWSCLGQGISHLMIVFSWASSSGESLISLLTNLETFHTWVKSNAIIVLTRCSLELTTLHSSGMRSWWWRAKIDIWSLCFSKWVSSLMIILTWTSCPWNSLISLLSNFETLDSRVKSDTVIVLTRCSLELTTLHCCGVRSGWRWSKIDVWSLCLC